MTSERGNPFPGDRQQESLSINYLTYTSIQALLSVTHGPERGYARVSLNATAHYICVMFSKHPTHALD